MTWVSHLTRGVVGCAAVPWSPRKAVLCDWSNSWFQVWWTAAERPIFDKEEMRYLLDDHNILERELMYDLMASSELFWAKKVGNMVLAPHYNEPMEKQRDKTLARILFLCEKGAFKGWLTEHTQQFEFRQSALCESLDIFDHSLSIKLGVHFYLWYGCCVISVSLMFANKYKGFRHMRMVCMDHVGFPVHILLTGFWYASQGRCSSVFWNKETSW